MPINPTQFKVIGVVAGSFAAVFGAIAGFTPAVDAWDKQGLPTVATRGFARDLDASNKAISAAAVQQIKEVQLDIARGKRDDAVTTYNRLEREAAKEVDPDTKITIQQDMRRQNDIIGALARQIQALSGIKGSN